ncbi:MAG: RsmB/NOP family class I SAM-dependent RNA methyltransferase [Marinovum sp.]|nr:RsmB/NOP family class I SAM-dependent RNA methyltransferase [Marinovum sp.]
MTPGARLQAAIVVLDKIVDGAPVEQALISWARASRFAGSKDRTAVRDHVYDVLRCWRSTAHWGDGTNGRCRILGLCRMQGVDVESLFGSSTYAPAPLSDDEANLPTDPSPLVAMDWPDWLWPLLCDGRSEETARAEAKAQQSRAPVDLRVNVARITRDKVQAQLADEGIQTAIHELAPTALRVQSGARAVARSQCYLNGLIELQDAASQAIVSNLPIEPGDKVLDYCAGGGGKTLALAARLNTQVDAYDISTRRMGPIPQRAKRAGATIRIVNEVRETYDLILCDAPCSGSGSWRRDPQGKWALTPERLDAINIQQVNVLEKASKHLNKNGILAYATCSLLHSENIHSVEMFCANVPDFDVLQTQSWGHEDGGDGFFLAIMQKS